MNRRLDRTSHTATPENAAIVAKMFAGYKHLVASQFAFLQLRFSCKLSPL